MKKNNDKKIIWAMGITALGLVAIVISLAVSLTTDGLQNPKVLLPVCFALGAMIISASVLFFAFKCKCKDK